MPVKYRADHVGSFLRPADLLGARASGAAPERLRELEDQQILRVLAKQKELGFEIFLPDRLLAKSPAGRADLAPESGSIYFMIGAEICDHPFRWSRLSV